MKGDYKPVNIKRTSGDKDKNGMTRHEIQIDISLSNLFIYGVSIFLVLIVAETIFEFLN